MLSFSVQKHDRCQVRKILAIRFAYLGDVILTVPAIKPLKDRFPESSICFLVGSGARQVLENNPFVDEIITYDPPWFYPRRNLSCILDYVRLVRLIRSKGFDTVIDFRGDLRNILFVVLPSGACRRVGSAMTGGGYVLTKSVPWTQKKHKVEFHLGLARALGVNTNTPGPMTLYPDGEDRARVQGLLQEMNIRDGDFLAGLHPGGRVDLKNWDIACYAEVADVLAKRYDAKILITGGADEVTLGEAVLRSMKGEGFNLCGKLSLKQLQVLLEEMSLFVTNDTGPLHIASGANVPTVAIFGPSEVWDTGPLSQHHRVVMKDLPCRAACDTYTCRNKDYHECLKSIKPAEVLAACAEVLEAVKKRPQPNKSALAWQALGGS